MDSGLCVAAIVMEESFNQAVAADTEGIHCNKQQQGGALLTEANAMPIRDEIETAIGYLVAKRVTAGRYKQLLAQWERDVVGKPQCVEGDDQNLDDGVGFQSLTLVHLSGPLMLTFVTTSIGLLVYFSFGYALDDVTALASYATNYGDKGNLSKKDAALQKRIRRMTFHQLWDRGKELQQQARRPMPEEVLTEAVDDGPRTEKLIQAVFK
jgi:hypothetical protein